MMRLRQDFKQVLRYAVLEEDEEWIVL